MARNHKPEEIIGGLRVAEIAQVHGCGCIFLLGFQYYMLGHSATSSL